MVDYAGRTMHGIPRSALQHAANPVLTISGLVERSLELTPADLVDLPRIPCRGTVSCLERGEIPDTDWSGMRLSDVLAVAGPSEGARFALISAGPYGVAVPIEEAGPDRGASTRGDRRRPLEDCDPGASLLHKCEMDRSHRAYGRC